MICPFLRTVFPLLQDFFSICLLVKYITSKYRVKKKDENNFYVFIFYVFFYLALFNWKIHYYTRIRQKVCDYKKPKPRFRLFSYLLKIFDIPVVISPILAKESVIHLVIRGCCWIAQKRIYNLIKGQPA